MIPYKPEPSGALQQGIIASHSPASAALVRAAFPGARRCGESDLQAYRCLRHQRWPMNS